MDEIQDRISLIISTKGMSNAEFAEAIDVQPSNISHIMSGRNKPSLDLVMKVLKRFPELRTDWLLMGKGAMNMDYSPSDRAATLVSKQPELFEANEAKTEKTETVSTVEAGSGSETRMDFEKAEDKKIYSENQVDKKEEISRKGPGNERRFPDFRPKSWGEEKRLDKIVFFYSDKTFSEYYPSED